MRERRDRVEREAQHLREGELRPPAGARLAAVGDGGLREADPDRHAAQEAVALRHRQQRVERRAVHQPEVAGVVRELDPRDLGEHAVEPARGGDLEARLPRARGAHGVHDVGAAPPRLEHLADQLRRVLEVAVDHHHDVAARVLEAGADRRLVAEVARQGDHLDPLVGGRERAHPLARGVARAVVDEDQLELEGAERGDGPRVERVDRVLLVVQGRDDAQQSGLAHRISVVRGAAGSAGRCAAAAGRRRRAGWRP